MSDVEKALELAREIAANGVEPECAENTARVLAAGFLALHRSHVAQAAVVEAAMKWRDADPPDGDVNDPTAIALAKAIDTLRAAKGER